jgi:hypothetical protein
VAAGVILVAVLVAAFAGEGYSRWKYHQSLWQAGPDRIHACGRDYLGPGLTDHLSDVRTVVRLAVIETVPTLQGKREVWAEAPAHSGGRARTSGCGIQVWLRTGENELRRYGLSGGP